MSTTRSQPLNSWQSRPNSKIVGDHSAVIGTFHRNIEIGTDKHPLASDVA
jgi:hypothetical protein